MRRFPASPITALIDDKPLYNLGESCGPDLTVADLLSPERLARLGDQSLGYGTSAGDSTLRALVAERHGIPEDRVLITTGGAAALFLLGLLCGDGEVVLGQPCYPPALDTLHGLGASVVSVRSRFEDGYRIDLDAFAAALSVHTQLVMFASPQNPAGVPIADDEVEQMITAMSHTCPDAMLLIDETFREATFGDALPAASFAGRSPQLLTCGSLSKAYGVGGLRIGWLTVPDPARYEQLRLAKFNSSISCGTLDEFLATELLARSDELLAPRGEHMARARRVVERWVKAHTDLLQWLPPVAGAFCCLQLDPDIDIDRFHTDLARQRVQVSPGPWFGDSPHIIRLGLTYEPITKLEMGLHLIGSQLAQ
jgi:aspartate/methionine/tyrosine aminotransferase